jgi:serine/threonine protein kinase
VLRWNRHVLKAGDLIDGKYRVIRLVGEGGMGAVYEGQNLRIDRRVAIKVMHASMTRDRELVARFEREAHAAAKIGSKHIADVLDLGDLPSGERFMILEYLEGETLLARLKRVERLTTQEVAPIGIQLLAGLAKVHDAGIVHRDLKPANIFLATADGGPVIVKILDFGICKMTRDKGTGDLSTGVGNLLGTLPYMCPEQIEHGTKQLDGRADIYSVGVMLYRCVTGRLPYRASNLVELLSQLRAGGAPHVCDLQPDVDKAFGAIIDKAIEWDPKARFPTARDFHAALVGWTQQRTRVNRMLADFLDASAPDVLPASPALPKSKPPSMFPAEDPKTKRYPGRDLDAQLIDNLHADEDATTETKKTGLGAQLIPRAQASTETRTKKRKRASIRETVPDTDDDDAKTIPKHGLKR